MRSQHNSFELIQYRVQFGFIVMLVTNAYFGAHLSSAGFQHRLIALDVSRVVRFVPWALPSYT